MIDNFTIKYHFEQFLDFFFQKIGNYIKCKQIATRKTLLSIIEIVHRSIYMIPII